jgi:hypothetical protein
MASTSKAHKATRASGRKSAAKKPAADAMGKKRPNDENDPGNTTKRPKKGARPRAANARTSTEENEIGREQQTSVDEIMQKYTELQG